MNGKLKIKRPNNPIIIPIKRIHLFFPLMLILIFITYLNDCFLSSFWAKICLSYM